MEKKLRSKERMTATAKSNNRLYRYNLAQEHITKDDTVLDVGCGSVFGKTHLKCKKYVGMDYSPDANPDIVADANEWQPDFEFDVFIGFESIEHCKNTDNYVKIAKQAKKHIFITCPASETLSFNPYHIYDFNPYQIRDLFEDENWKQVFFTQRIVKRGNVIQQVHHFERV